MGTPKIDEQQRQKNDKSFAVNQKELLSAVIKNARSKYGCRSGEPIHEHLLIDGFEIRIDVKKKYPDIPTARVGTGDFLAPHKITGVFPMNDLMVQIDKYVQALKIAETKRKEDAVRHAIAKEKLCEHIQVDEFITFVKLDGGVCTVSTDGMVRFELKFDPMIDKDLEGIIRLIKAHGVKQFGEEKV